MIPEYADDLDFENRLPPGQAPIMTTSVQRFHAYMHRDLLINDFTPLGSPS